MKISVKTQTRAELIHFLKEVAVATKGVVLADGGFHKIGIFSYVKDDTYHNGYFEQSDTGKSLGADVFYHVLLDRKNIRTLLKQRSANKMVLEQRPSDALDKVLYKKGRMNGKRLIVVFDRHNYGHEQSMEALEGLAKSAFGRAVNQSLGVTIVTDVQKDRFNRTPVERLVTEENLLVVNITKDYSGKDAWARNVDILVDDKVLSRHPRLHKKLTQLAEWSAQAHIPGRKSGWHFGG